MLVLGSIHMGVTQHYHGKVCFSGRQPPSGLAVVTSCEVYQNHSYASTGGAGREDLGAQLNGDVVILT